MGTAVAAIAATGLRPGVAPIGVQMGLGAVVAVMATAVAPLGTAVAPAATGLRTAVAVMATAVAPLGAAVAPVAPLGKPPAVGPRGSIRTESSHHSDSSRAVPWCYPPPSGVTW